MSSTPDPRRAQILQVLSRLRLQSGVISGEPFVDEILAIADSASPESQAPTGARASRPPLDDEFLRREALDLAVRAQRGQEGGAEIVARAEVLLGFLRGEAPSRVAQEDSAWKAGER